MMYTYNNDEYLVEYEVIDLEDHLFNIVLIAEDGSEFDISTLPTEDQIRLQEEVEAETSGSRMDDVYERMLDR